MLLTVKFDLTSTIQKINQEIVLQLPEYPTHEHYLIAYSRDIFSHEVEYSVYPYDIEDMWSPEDTTGYLRTSITNNTIYVKYMTTRKWRLEVKQELRDYEDYVIKNLTDPNLIEETVCLYTDYLKYKKSEYYI